MNNPSHKRPTGLNEFYFGAPYYPEHWDKSFVEKDAKLMKEASFNLVRLAEFAWDLMEPSEGNFDFSVFDNAIATLGKEGVQSMLCTPTATPPRWLTIKHPEMLRIDKDGIVQQHGSRQHACHSSKIFREYSKKITKAMAEHYATNPNVVGWQTDNEFFCHFSECHCPNCQVSFRKFLKNKYGTIEELNQRWGTAFWALTYSNFDEIETPKEFKPTYPNPAAMLDYQRFLSHDLVKFQHDQTEILREANSNWWITHNGLFGCIDYRDLCKDLDFLSYDVYPFFAKTRVRMQTNSFNLDRTRAWTGNFMIPEHQSGPGGQPPYFHDNPEPGEVRLYSYNAVARGADSILYFRWRTALFGSEQYWCGILDHDNIPRRRYDEIKQIGKELRIVGKELLGTSVKFDVAIAYADTDVTSSHNIYSLGLPSPYGVAESIHNVLYNKNFEVGCIHPSDDLSDLKVIFIPHWTVFKQEWIENLKEFADNGGIVVVGARTATRNTDNNIIPETIPGIFSELCGITINEYGRQNDNENRPLCLDINLVNVRTDLWYEEMVCNDDKTEVIASWKNRHLKNKSGITFRKADSGNGGFMYVGTYLTPPIITALLPKIQALSGLTNKDLPKGVSQIIRENSDTQYRFVLNSNYDAVNMNEVTGGLDLLSGETKDGAWMLEGNGVCIFKEGK
ncbi:MAG: beta-galactosidase [Kiritimatiellae bacterium]|jgi:beta-galactosidase|nr:beta-galactosidase [Kiritimatiellia bacterium]